MCSVDEKVKDDVSQNEIAGIWGFIETDHCSNSGRNVEAIWYFYPDGTMEDTCAPTSCDCGEWDEEITREMNYKIKGDEITIDLISSTPKDYQFYESENFNITVKGKYKLELNGLKLFIEVLEEIDNENGERLKDNEGEILEFEKQRDL
jgi:hypothetical protein